MLPDEVNEVDKYIEAENCRHVVASVIPDWEEELEQEQSLRRTWPVLLGDPREFASELEGRPLDYQADIMEEQNENDKKGGGACRIEPGRHEEEEELEALLKMDYSHIQSLPIPTVPNVPGSVIKQTMMTPFRRCNVCSNCLRHKQRKYACLAIEAVKKWDEALGGVDGQTVAAMATKLTEKVSTHGMRVGKGMRCGECRTCRIKWKSELCMTLKAVRDGELPDRLKPAAAEALKRRRLLGIAFDPYAEKKSGRDMLLNLAGDQGINGASDTEEERWGVANVDDKILKSLQDGAKSKKRKKYYRWNCSSKIDGKSICGASNNESALSCMKCKAARWSGEGGQLELRVAAILAEGQIHIREPGKFQEHVKERILREYGQGGDELDVSLDDVTNAIQKYTEKETSQHEDNSPESYERITQIGRAIRNSDFGDAIMKFDASILQSIREIAALRGVDLDSGWELCSRPETNQEEHDPLPAVFDNLVSDIKYSASLSDLSNALFLRNLELLRKSLFDLYHKSGDQVRINVESFWSCPGARKQFIRVVKGSAFATVQSVFFDSIQRPAQLPSICSDPIQAFARCSFCGGNHRPALPVWRAHPIMAKIIDNKRGLERRYESEDDNMDKITSWRMENITRNVRYPLYHLVEHVLNTLSLQEASSRIPVTLRPFPRRRFIESTKVPAFPALPVDGTNWFNLTERASFVNSCIPDNKNSPIQIYKDVSKDRNKAINSKLGPQSGIQPRPGAFKMVAPASQYQPLEGLTTKGTSSIDKESLKEFPKDVQLIFQAASEFGIQRSILERAAKRFKGLYSQ
eukprot:jgi/Picsp_1/4003/NSC_01515-R1_---NA---